MNIELSQHEQWRLQAACAGMATENYDLFYPPVGGSAQAPRNNRAKAICAGCPVRAECLAYAEEHEIAVGVWGGTTPAERGKRLDRHGSLAAFDEYAGTVDPPIAQRRFLSVPAEFDLWEGSFTKDEMEATVEARRRRREILARVDAELDGEPAEPTAAPQRQESRLQTVHGFMMYRQGCRCSACRAGNAAHSRKYRQRKRDAQQRVAGRAS